MLKNTHRSILFTLFLLLIGFVISSPNLVLAQTSSLGIAQQIKVEGVSSIPNGSIISYQDNKYQLSVEAYDKSMFAVSATLPALEITDQVTQDNAGMTPAINSGQVQVRVNGQNGPIAKGDRVTSSSTPGVGMKANKSGFVLGIADEDFQPDSATDEGLIAVNLDFKFSFAEDTPGSEKIASRLRDIVSLSTLSVAEDPLQSLRYLIAGIVMIGSFAFAFLSFGKLARNGIEALGRNPLASHPIVLAMAFNVVICILIMIIGLAAAYLVVTW